MNKLRKHLEPVHQWYRGFIPRALMTQRFINFVASSYDLAYEVAKGPKLLFSSTVESACTDGKTIWLPTFYLEEDFYDMLQVPFELMPVAATALVNGSQLHEALHVKLSTCNMKEWLDTSNDAKSIAQDYEGLMLLCMNLVEDLHIEQVGRADFHTLSRFLTAKNHVLFNDELLPKVEATLTAPMRWSEFALQLAVFKRLDLQDDVPDMFKPWQAHVAALNRVNRTHSRDDRLYLAVRLAQSIMADPRLTPDEKQQRSSDGDGQPIDGGKGDGTPLDGEELAQLLAKPGMARLAKLVNQAIEKAKSFRHLEFIRHAPMIDLSYNLPTQFKDVLEVQHDKVKLEPDKAWLALGQSIRLARAVNHTPGRARNVGNVLMQHQLHRLSVDGNVLAFRDGAAIRRGAPELIMLGDVSGSMHAYANGMSGDSLLAAVAKAMLGGFLSMVEARLPCAVYGHTSYDGTGTRGSADGSVVFATAAYEMPLLGRTATITGNSAERFHALTQVDSNCNLDGVAIEFVAKQFTSRPGSKLLAVLSDGKPNGLHYRGEAAMQHTTKVVDGLRRKGVMVVGVSLVESVVKDNDEIYGKEFNLLAYGRNLSLAMRKLVQHAAQVTID